MTISTLNIKITVDETKNNEEWVAKEKTNIWGDKTTIKFYQREKNKSDFQKIADFFTGVKPGREVAAKYINELGLTNTCLNPKNSNPVSADTELNTIFQDVAKKTLTDNAFEASERLVSHLDNDTQKEISIKINGNEIQNATRNRQKLQLEEVNFFLTAVYTKKSSVSPITIPSPAIELAVDIREKSPKKITFDQVSSASEELLKFKAESKGKPWSNAEFGNRLDELISVLKNKLSSAEKTALS
jgi:hypothetical protein